MAKTALINRDQKRRATVKKFAAKRAELFAIINNSKASDEDRTQARDKLGRLPRNASPVQSELVSAAFVSPVLPAAVLPGSTKVALAVPVVTVPEVTGVPMVVPLCETVKVTVPALTVPAPLVTLAESVTF